MGSFLGAHCLVGGKRILINRCDNIVGKETQWKYCDLRSHHVCYGNREEEHWVWIFGVVWDGLWGSLEVLGQVKAMLTPDYNQGVSQVMEMWDCKQHRRAG